MIARVRIAPVERWCPYQLSTGCERSRAESVGMIMPIYTESMRPGTHCDGKAWKVHEETVDQIREQLGIVDWKPDETWVCEHMLEMD
jgi:hypothetical protein